MKLIVWGTGLISRVVLVGPRSSHPCAHLTSLGTPRKTYPKGPKIEKNQDRPPGLNTGCCVGLGTRKHLTKNGVD